MEFSEDNTFQWASVADVSCCSLERVYCTITKKARLLHNRASDERTTHHTPGESNVLEEVHDTASTSRLTGAVASKAATPAAS